MGSSPATVRPVDDPEEEFSQENELNFRREISTYLMQLADDVVRSEAGDSVASSLSSKRQGFLSPPVGVVRILG